MLHCYNKCDSTLRFSNRCHYHCPICAAVLQKTAHMRRQINSHLVECAANIPDADLSAIVLHVLNFTEIKSDTHQVPEQQPDKTSGFVDLFERSRLQDSDDENIDDDRSEGNVMILMLVYIYFDSYFSVSWHIFMLTLAEDCEDIVCLFVRPFSRKRQIIFIQLVLLHKKC